MPLSGPVGTPLLGGVAIVSSDFSVSARGKPISRDKPQKTKEFKESGAGTPPRFFSGTPPPLSLYRKACGPQYHEKRPILGAQTGSEKPGCPERRIVVNRTAGNQGCLFPYQDTTVSDICITSKMCFCFTKTLARGRSTWTPERREGNHGEATARRVGAAAWRTIGVRVTEAEETELRERAQAACLSTWELPTPPGAGSAGADGGRAAAGGSGATGAEPDRGESESNGAGAQLESRVVAGRDPGDGRARQRSPLRSCLVRDVREWAERIGRKHER